MKWSKNKEAGFTLYVRPLLTDISKVDRNSGSGVAVGPAPVSAEKSGNGNVIDDGNGHDRSVPTIRQGIASPAKPAVLNSWKEIASYLGRGVRTVQRWEREAKLPVHRPKGRDRSAVLALSSELDEWLDRTPVRSAEDGHDVTFGAENTAAGLLELARDLLAHGERLAKLHGPGQPEVDADVRAVHEIVAELEQVISRDSCVSSGLEPIAAGFDQLGNGVRFHPTTTRPDAIRPAIAQAFELRNRCSELLQAQSLSVMQLQNTVAVIRRQSAAR